MHVATWDSGIGASKNGGRWNKKGLAVVYCSVDPSTALLEVAVHVGFHALDTEPRVWVQAEITDTSLIYIIDENSVPNEAWLRPGFVSRGQKEFGNDKLSIYPFVSAPSTVSTNSWNVIINPAVAKGSYNLLGWTNFELDGRLNPPPP